jgi:hypothetical protein
LKVLLMILQSGTQTMTCLVKEFVKVGRRRAAGQRAFDGLPAVPQGGRARRSNKWSSKQRVGRFGPRGP